MKSCAGWLRARRGARGARRVRGPGAPAILREVRRHQADDAHGIVTLVDWRNPHVHVFMNVKDAQGDVLNWAIELESPIDLEHERLARETLRPATRSPSQGMRRATAAARRGAIGRRARPPAEQVLNVDADAAAAAAAAAADAALARRPAAPRRARGGVQGYWAYPSVDRARGERRERSRWTSRGC